MTFKGTYAAFAAVALSATTLALEPKKSGRSPVLVDGSFGAAQIKAPRCGSMGKESAAK
jgi:hypothetical protein